MMNAVQRNGGPDVAGPIVVKVFVYRTVNTFIQKIYRDSLQRGHRIAESALLWQDDDSPRSLTCVDSTGDCVGGKTDGGDVIGRTIGRVESLAIR